MRARTSRLLNSLKLLASALDGWLARRTSRDAHRSACVDRAPDDRTHHLRRAFPLADTISIEALTAICSPMSVPGGTTLVLEGEQPEAIYIVVTGQFAAHQQAASDTESPRDYYGAGDVIGDTEFITGEARAATITAQRNSELLQVSKHDLQTAAARCPGVLVTICSGVVRRLRRAQSASASPFRCRTFCLVPVDAAIDTAPIIQKIAATLEAFGTVTIVSAEQGEERLSAWFSETERCFEFVLFQADRTPTAWTKFCLQQCDRIVLLARGDNEPADGDALAPDRINLPKNTPVSLVLLWHEAIVPTRTTAWLKSVNPGGHHHVRSYGDIEYGDIERASRLIAGRGLGLVLSGGGARALAHVGVIDALRNQGIQIDAIGGTSIGAIVAAVFALDWDLAATVRSLAAAFNRRRFSDFAVPRTALYSERAFARTLGQCLGDIAFEDAPIPLFCVSTNLTKSISTVHRSGRLVTWLRATSAVPGICPPIVEQNNVYVDGGVLNNAPTDAIRDFGVATVITVDVGSTLEGQARSDDGRSLPNIFDLLWRVGTIGSDAAASRLRRDSDVVLKPDVSTTGLFDWNACERAIAAGHQVTLEHLEEIKTALGRVI
jgi:NTE family protein